MNLRPSLISSFHFDGTLAALANWPSPDVGCELYLFMRSDALLSGCSLLRAAPLGCLSRWFWNYIPSWIGNAINSIPIQLDRHVPHGITFKRRPRVQMSPPDINVCEWLASRHRDVRYIKSMAHKVSSHVSSEQLVGFATFFPEISAADSSGEQALGALKFVVNLSRELNANFGFNLRVIELVCGGLFDHITWSKRNELIGTKIVNSCVFSASPISRDAAFDRLISRLKILTAVADGQIQFALELEPGPLYALSTPSSLLDICDRIVQDDLSRNVGLNCDIAHWTLAGIKIDPPDPILDILKPFIIHAHVADSGFGHFGDLIPGTVRNDDFFVKWFRFVESAYRINSARATGFISLELELPANLEQVKLGVGELKRILGLASAPA